MSKLMFVFRFWQFNDQMKGQEGKGHNTIRQYETLDTRVGSSASLVVKNKL